MLFVEFFLSCFNIVGVAQSGWQTGV